MANDRFSVVDYVVFSIMLLISALIGVWYGCGPGGKQKTTSEYLLGNRKMRHFPVAISLLVSYLSAITLLGVPSEIYTYGAQYYVLILSYFIICGTVAIVFVPMFRRVNLTCANEVRLTVYSCHFCSRSKFEIFFKCWLLQNWCCKQEWKGWNYLSASMHNIMAR